MSKVNSTEEDIKSLCSTLERFFGRTTYDGFHILLARKKPLLRMAFFIANNIGKTRISQYIALILLIVIVPNVRKYNFDATIICFAPTSNNKKVLSNLIEFSKLDKKNLDFFGRSPGIIVRICAVFNFKLLSISNKILSGYKDSSPYLKAQMQMGCAAYIVFLKCIPPDTRLALLANDHSSVPLAFKLASKSVGAKTVYRQHAPVTANFPSLDFDLSILFDQHSADIYSSSINTTDITKNGEIKILAPFESEYTPIIVPDRIKSIGLCLSRVYLAKSIFRTLEYLLTLEGIEKIYIRRHPADKLSILDFQFDERIMVDDGESTLKRFASMCDVVILPNSGVCVEILHFGCPCFYVSGLDMLDDDTYGFVKNRIIPKLNYTQYNSKEILNFAREFYNDNWVRRFSNLDATINGSIDEMRSTVVTSMLSLKREVD